MENFSERERTSFRKIDCKTKIKLNVLNENGFILLNNLISLSIILLLLTAIGTVVYWSIQNGKKIVGNIELSRELTYVTERITEDANLADRVKIYHSSQGDTISISYRTTSKENVDFQKVAYIRMDAPNERLSRIVVNDANAPITGNSELGQIHITKFEVKKISGHLVLMEIEGMSRVTKNSCALRTVIYTQGEITEEN